MTATKTNFVRPQDRARSNTAKVMTRYSGPHGSGQRARLARMDPLNPSADWSAAQVLYSVGLSDVASDHGYSPVEIATSVAVSLWARYTRSHTFSGGASEDVVGEKPRSYDLGASLRACAGSEVSPSISRRISSLTSARSPEAFYSSLRTLVALIVSKRVPIDYSMLAADLALVFTYEGTLDMNSPTFAKWNRSFWRVSKPSLVVEKKSEVEDDSA